MQVSRAHKTGLGWMGVNPPKHHYILALTKFHDLLLVICLTGVGSAGLFGNHQVADEKCIVDRGAT